MLGEQGSSLLLLTGRGAADGSPFLEPTFPFLREKTMSQQQAKTVLHPDHP